MCASANTQKRKAVFLDIDGTLISRNGGSFADDREAMEEAAGKGHLLFLNTGRSFANIPGVLFGLSALRGIAAGGGAHILLADARGKNPGYQTIYHKWISDDQLALVFAWCENHSRCCILEGERACYIININRSSWIFELDAPIPVSSQDDFKKKSLGDFITKLTFDSPMPEAAGAALTAHVSPLADDSRFLESFCTLNRFADYTEGIIKGENKAKAMKIVLDKMGIGREDSIAIGDSANDLDMIRFAGLGIAMGNACAELKAAAGATTGACGKGGVAEALRNFVL